MTREEVLAALARVEQERDALLAKLVAIEVTSTAQRPEDRLLTVKEAAAQLATTADWLYRHANRLPFTVRLGPGHLRFREQGIQEYLRRRK